MPQKSQPVSEARGDRTFLSAAEAAALLGVRRRTLYTYASRGLLRRAEGGYLAEDVRRLAARANAHRGHTAVAAAALRWGEPVLDSAITLPEGGRLFYRGKDAATLSRTAHFEVVADLLFGGEAGPWPVGSETAGGAPTFGAILDALPALGRDASLQPFDRAGCRAVVTALFDAAGAWGPGRLAERLARALGAPPEVIERALIVAADHELNASTFTARIAASAGASPTSVVGAALHTFTGRRHGAASTRIEALLRTLPRGHEASALRARLSAGETIPGFGHPLYPDGDPRLPPLVDGAAAHVRDREALADVERVRAVVEAETGVRANLDFGLVMLSRALGFPDGTPMLLFALGRSAGWLAHALEQREQGELLRPRARYVGP